MRGQKDGFIPASTAGPRTVEGNHSTHYEYPRTIAAKMGVTEDHSVRARAGVFLPDGRSIYSKWIKLVPEDLEPNA